MFALALACCFVAADPAPAFSPVGTWEGALDVGAIKLRLAFKITAQPDGTFKSTMDSIDQNAKDIPVKETKITDGMLTLDLKDLGASYSGKPAADGKTVAGTWKQSGQDFKLDLTRVEKATVLKRPQEPVKPYPYHEEEVTVDNPKAEGVKLAGTFTRPMADGKYPAVVLISGSGPQDRDESILGHKPFLVLADHLTRKGIAVLRCDDRGVGKSTGKQSTATSADFATDVAACVQYLKTRSDVDAKRIGLAGHSEGGLIAPMVAAEHPDDVAFIVLLAGPGLPGDQLLGDQLTAILKASGKSDAEVAKLKARQQALLKAAMKGADAKALVEIALKHSDGQTEEEKKQLSDESAMKAILNPWMLYFLKTDPRPTLKKVRCPVLAVNGEFDLQVTPKENLAAVAAALKEGGNAKVTIKEFPGLNHLFQHTKTGMVSEYGTIEETLAPEMLETVTSWILGLK